MNELEMFLETYRDGPLPLWVLSLKAERVQDAAPQTPGLLAVAERLLKRLKEMPGWCLVPGGMALARVRELGHRTDAAEYAAFAVQSAGRAGYPVDVFVAGKHVVLALRGRGRGAQGAINDNLLDFAACLG